MRPGNARIKGSIGSHQKRKQRHRFQCAREVRQRFQCSEMASALHEAKLYMYMILVQFGSAGMTILTQRAFDQGMSTYVLVVYRHAFAALILLPFALYFERKGRPRLTFWICCQIFALGLIGIAANLNMYYIGLKLTSPTFATALSNLLPAMTFLLAIVCRMETIKVHDRRSQAKVIGTVVCVLGAMVMTLYKGPVVPMFHHHHHSSSVTPTNSTLVAHADAQAGSGGHWLAGCLLVVASTAAWAVLFVLQSAALKAYPAELTLTTMMCFVGTLQSAVFAFSVERDMSKWAMGLDIKLLASVYSALAGSAVAYYLQGLCMKEKGPVFATAFIPLTIVIVAILGSLFLSETLYAGSMVGALLITVGLYAVLWGKMKESNNGDNHNADNDVKKGKPTDVEMGTESSPHKTEADDTKVDLI